MPEPRRGDVWLADLEPTAGPGLRRPVLVVSDDRLNRGRAEVVLAVPLTTRDRGIPTHIPLTPPEGGVRATSYAMCEHIRSISRTRLVERWGAAGPKAMTAAEDVLRALLAL
jgi:mRNA interferase MazF